MIRPESKPARAADRQVAPSFSSKLFAALSWPSGAIPPVLLEPMPLRIGLGEDLALLLPESEWSRLRKAIAGWVTSPTYLLAVAADEAQRHDLNGEPVGPVSEADRLGAAHRLLARELALSRKAAERQEAKR
jgi:sRNA-binding protein